MDKQTSICTMRTVATTFGAGMSTSTVMAIPLYV